MVGQLPEQLWECFMPTLTLYSKLLIKAEFLLIKTKCYESQTVANDWNSVVRGLELEWAGKKQWKKWFVDSHILSFIIQLLHLKKDIFFLKKKNFSIRWQYLLWAYRAFYERFRCISLKTVENMRFKSSLNRSNAPKFLQCPLFFYVRPLVKFTCSLSEPKFLIV